MNLEEAIKIINSYDFNEIAEFEDGEMQEAIDTVLKALDERYNKGYQDGFKQAKFDCEMDKLDGR